MFRICSELNIQIRKWRSFFKSQNDFKNSKKAFRNLKRKTEIGDEGKKSNFSLMNCPL